MDHYACVDFLTKHNIIETNSFSFEFESELLIFEFLLDLFLFLTQIYKITILFRVSMYVRVRFHSLMAILFMTS